MRRRYEPPDRSTQQRPINPKKLRGSIYKGVKAYELGDEEWTTGKQMATIIGICGLYERDAEIPGDLVAAEFQSMGLETQVMNDKTYFNISKLFGQSLAETSGDA